MGKLSGNAFYYPRFAYAKAFASVIKKCCLSHKPIVCPFLHADGSVFDFSKSLYFKK